LGLSDGELDHPGKKTKGASFVHALLALHSCPLLRKASIQAIAQLARQGASLIVAAEKVDLIEYGRGIWVVVEGSVDLQIRVRGTHLEEKVGPGELLGSILPLGSEPEVFVVKSEEGSWILFIDQEVFFDVMEDHFDLARSSMSFMAAQVEARNRSGEEPWQQQNALPSARGLPDLGSSPIATERPPVG
jgi:CRP-like cAMP-binding protein